jgi:hypothetical protein
MSLKVLCFRNIMSQTVDFLVHSAVNGRLSVMQPGEQVDLPIGQMASDPTFSLTSDAAIKLMDEMWAAGIRPTQVGTAGQLAATERHLEDMRTLVFKGVK